MNHVEATLQGLVEYLFVGNKTDAKVYLNLPQGDDGIRNNHDLFMFFVDLLCKGMVFLYGNEDRKLSLDKLTPEQLEFIKKKLRNAGVELRVNIAPVDFLDPTNQHQEAYIKPCIVKNNNSECSQGSQGSQDSQDNLEDYVLRIVSNKVEYSISFALVRLAT